MLMLVQKHKNLSTRLKLSLTKLKLLLTGQKMSFPNPPLVLWISWKLSKAPWILSLRSRKFAKHLSMKLNLFQKKFKLLKTRVKHSKKHSRVVKLSKKEKLAERLNLKIVVLVMSTLSERFQNLLQELKKKMEKEHALVAQLSDHSLWYNFT